ncbi:hypothetical protein [Paenisporosarcina sp. TG-14]|uniref:hypothetical protein n=1 Tax=Paenisporosarcina sp. TG-14 TaxID=1231057 RepID=UPI00038014BD|nr:hypothetical protein [Paenisporosarcina sp. TG-14]
MPFYEREIEVWMTLNDPLSSDWNSEHNSNYSAFRTWTNVMSLYNCNASSLRSMVLDLKIGMKKTPQ